MTRFIPEILCTVVVLILQVVIAPAIGIGYGLPNFVLAFCVAFAVASRRTNVVVMPFLAGLAFDLLGTGPVPCFVWWLLVWQRCCTTAWTTTRCSSRLPASASASWELRCSTLASA